MKNNALIIFTRNPELGKVKTRLAKTIGDENALIVYQDLLLHTQSVIQDLDIDKFVFYDAHINLNDIWNEEIYTKKLQNGLDLGERMQNAFQELFDDGYENCIIIGSDLFDLTSEVVLKAVINLETNDVVIGPAEDGGYYLLGLNSMLPEIFKNKMWSTEIVLADTLKDLQNKSVLLLETLNDIDTYQDLERSNYNLNLKAK